MLCSHLSHLIFWAWSCWSSSKFQTRSFNSRGHSQWLMQQTSQIFWLPRSMDRLGIFLLLSVLTYTVECFIYCQQRSMRPNIRIKQWTNDNLQRWHCHSLGGAAVNFCFLYHQFFVFLCLHVSLCFSVCLLRCEIVLLQIHSLICSFFAAACYQACFFLFLVSQQPISSSFLLLFLSIRFAT